MLSSQARNCSCSGPQAMGLLGHALHGAYRYRRVQSVNGSMNVVKGKATTLSGARPAKRQDIRYLSQQPLPPPFPADGKRSCAAQHHHSPACSAREKFGTRNVSTPIWIQKFESTADPQASNSSTPQTSILSSNRFGPSGSRRDDAQWAFTYCYLEASGEEPQSVPTAC